MVIAVCTLHLSIPFAGSLKEKRQVVKSLTTRIRNEFNVSIAEVDDHDYWQSAVLGIACVSTSQSYAHGLIEAVVTFIDRSRPDCPIGAYEIEMLWNPDVSLVSRRDGVRPLRECPWYERPFAAAQRERCPLLRVTGGAVTMDEGLHPFPLLALVGQAELKTALLLGLINPAIGGVLISGPYGVGKTSAVRSLLDLLPMEAPRPDRAAMRMRLLELPLNARLEDVVGTLNERVALEQQRVQLEPGILAHADGNLLYVDEINLLTPVVADAILDAAAQGRTFVRRGAATRLYASRFVLIGSFNPEEGELRPQILDRFGLRVWVAPLAEPTQRLQVYRRAQAFRADPVTFRATYAAQTTALAEEIEAARAILPHVSLPPEIETQAIALVQALQVPSHRAEIALLEGARARAAADFRTQVNAEDLRRVAPLALRQRQSPRITAYGERYQAERTEIEAALETIIGAVPSEPSNPTRVLRQIEAPDAG